MIPDDTGTLPGSQIYFHTASNLAKQLYLYPTYIGHFFCDSRYSISRKRFDSFLLLYITDGSGFVESGGRRFPVRQGDIVLIDCYLPHRYFTLSGWEILWVHFDGVMARGFFDLLTRNGLLLRLEDHYAVMRGLRRLVRSFDEKEQFPEALLSKYLNDIFTALILSSDRRAEISQRPSAIDESIQYISEHLSEEISLELLASQAHLSPFYFSRLFKHETGFSPHQYLIMARLDYSRYLLKTSELSLREIACRCGFRTESSFCVRFRQAMGITPGAYRVSE